MVVLVTACADEVISFGPGGAGGAGLADGTGLGPAGPGAGAGGGAGNVGTGNVGTGNVGTGDGGTGHVGPGSAVDTRCGSICGHGELSGCAQTGCEARCLAGVENDGPCSAELDALLDCWSADLQMDLCSPPAGCADAHHNYLLCGATPFMFGECPAGPAVQGSLPGGGCSAVTCDGDGTQYFESCFCASGGSCQCECVRDGVLIGNCSEFNDEGCFPTAACCEFVFIANP